MFYLETLKFIQNFKEKTFVLHSIHPNKTRNQSKKIIKSCRMKTIHRNHISNFKVNCFQNGGNCKLSSHLHNYKHISFSKVLDITHKLIQITRLLVHLRTTSKFPCETQSFSLITGKIRVSNKWNFIPFGSSRVRQTEAVSEVTITFFTAVDKGG